MHVQHCSLAFMRVSACSRPLNVAGLYLLAAIIEQVLACSVAQGVFWQCLGRQHGASFLEA